MAPLHILTRTDATQICANRSSVCVMMQAALSAISVTVLHLTHNISLWVTFYLLLYECVIVQIRIRFPIST